jgi:hypothetical protein
MPQKVEMNFKKRNQPKPSRNIKDPGQRGVHVLEKGNLQREVST